MSRNEFWDQAEGETTTAPRQPSVVPLYSQSAPGSEHWTHEEQDTVFPPPYHRIARNVSRPTLTAFLPDPAVTTGTAVIVCPGGAFHSLAMDFEGTDVAHWLVAHGVAAFVLKYRLIQTPEDVLDYARQMEALMQGPPSERDARIREASGPIEPLAVADGRRAMELVRERASEWAIDPDRIGMLGFSAGGRVAAGVVLEHDEASRPNFAVLVYGAPWNEVVAPPDAPPLFVCVAHDDPLGAVQRCLDMYSAWWCARLPAELHIYAKGGHGFGMRKQGLPSDQWIDLFGDWLGALGLLDRSIASGHSRVGAVAPEGVHRGE